MDAFTVSLVPLLNFNVAFIVFNLISLATNCTSIQNPSVQPSVAEPNVNSTELPELDPVLIKEPGVSTPLAPSLNGLAGEPVLYSAP